MKSAIAILLFAVAPALIGQVKEMPSVTANPIVTTVRQMEGRYAKNLTGAADEMPADKYSYRPTPEQITFGHLMMHSSGGKQFAVRGRCRQRPARKK